MKNIFKALANFQQEMPILQKDTSGHGYKYTPLATIIEKINPILKKNGLGFYQLIEGTQIKTVIFHVESGETIEGVTDLPVGSIVYSDTTNSRGDAVKRIIGFEGMNTAQAYGSLITYFRRYSLSAVLGLVTDNDADARNKRIEKEKPLPELLPTDTKNWEKVKKAILNGYTITQIQTKWQLSDSTIKQLENETV